MSLSPSRRCALLTATSVLLAATSAAWAQPIIDGQNFAVEYGAAVTSQRWQTGFGDDVSGDQFGFGSELDQMFITNDADFLYIGISGNTENNGNCTIVFIDTDNGATGANTLRMQSFGTPVPGMPRYLSGNVGEPGLDGLIFDPGFAANHVIGYSGGSPIGSQTRTYDLVNWTDLDPIDAGLLHTNTIAGMITSGDPTASGTAGTLGSFLSGAPTGILAALDNSNVNGVEGGFPPKLAANDPATALTGSEFAIPLSLLGVGVDDQVCLLAMVSGSNGFLANQILPTDQSVGDPNLLEFNNLGFPPLDLGDELIAAGDQFVCYTIVAAGCPQTGCEQSDVNGDCLVDLSDLAIQLSNFGTPSGATFEQGDLDGNGSVDLADLAIMLSDFGTICT